MEEQRRKAIVAIMASILAARRLAALDRPGNSSPARESAIADAIQLAERIMQRLEERHY